MKRGPPPPEGEGARAAVLAIISVAIGRQGGAPVPRSRNAFPESRSMPHKKTPIRLAALAAALAWPLHAQAAVPAGAAAEIVSLQGAGDQRAAAAPDWQPARPAQ